MPRGETEKNEGGSAALVLQQEREYAERRARYKEVMEEFLADAGADTVTKQSRLREFHQAGVACFNAFEKSIPWSSLLRADDDTDWYTEKGETAANLLGTIAKHFQVIQTKASEAGLSSSDCPPPSPTAYAAMQRIAKDVVPGEADKLREKFISLDLPTHGFDHAAKEKPRMSTWQKIIGVVLGSILIAVSLVLAICFPSPTRFQFFVFRTVLALGAAGFAAVITGFLHVEGRFKRITVSAGAGLGVWVIVYFVNPPALAE